MSSSLHGCIAHRTKHLWEAGHCLEDHPRTCTWLGSPPFISHEKAIWNGNNPTDVDLLSMVVNHLLTGMILQVGSGRFLWDFFAAEEG